MVWVHNGQILSCLKLFFLTKSHPVAPTPHSKCWQLWGLTTMPNSEFFIYLMRRECVGDSMCVKLRGQLVGLTLSSLHLAGCRDWTQVIRFGGQVFSSAKSSRQLLSCRFLPMEDAQNELQKYSWGYLLFTDFLCSWRTVNSEIISHASPKASLYCSPHLLPSYAK